MANAAGLCVGGNCQLVACAFGWGNCDALGENGCEEDLAREVSCGQCRRSCTSGEFCQNGPAGFACSAGVICPVGEHDLDGSRDNGCEWRAQSTTFAPLVPIATGPASAAALGDGRFLMAFEAAGQRLAITLGPQGPEGPVVDLGQAPQTTEPGQEGQGGRTPELALWKAGAVGGPLAVAAFADGLRIWPLDDTQPEVGAVGLPCEEASEASAALGAGPARMRAMQASEDGLWVATGRALALLRAPQHCGQAAVCWDAGAIWDARRYWQAFAPAALPRGAQGGEGAASAMWALSPNEWGACPACVLDPLEAGSGCQPPGYCAPIQEAASGEGCAACTFERGACPDFSPVALLPSRFAGRAYAVTRRGLVVLEKSTEGWVARARAEEAFAPGVARASGFVAGALMAGGAMAPSPWQPTVQGTVETLVLLDSSGFLRVLAVGRRPEGLGDRPGELDVWSTGPDVGVSLDFARQGPVRLAAWEGHVAVSDGTRLLWLRLSGASARQAEVAVQGRGAAEPGHAATLIASEAAQGQAPGFTLLYHEAARWNAWRLSRQPD